MTYTIPTAVPGAGDPPAEFNTARAAILDLDTRVTATEGFGLLAPKLTYNSTDIGAGTNVTTNSGTPGVIRHEGGGSVLFNVVPSSHILRHLGVSTTPITLNGWSSQYRGPSSLKTGQSLFVHTGPDGWTDAEVMGGEVVRPEGGAVSTVYGDTDAGKVFWTGADPWNVALVRPAGAVLNSPIILSPVNDSVLTITPDQPYIGPTVIRAEDGGVRLDFLYNRWIIEPLDADPVVDTQPRISGQYYSTTFPVSPGNVDAGVFGTSGQRVFMLPFAVTAPMNVDRLGLIISTAGGAGSFIRYGIYTHDVGFTTFRKIVSASVAADSTGTKTSTISARLNVGMHWLAVGSTDTAGTLIVTRVSRDGRHAGFNGNSNPQYQVTEFAPRWDGITLSSDLPATLSVSSVSQWIENDIPALWVRKA